MTGETNLDILIRTMMPELAGEKYVFCTINNEIETVVKMEPWAMIKEKEGITIIVEKENADLYDLKYDTVYARITLNVHSSLNAVGLTALVSKKLMDFGISANVVAGYYHDHIFVQFDYAEKALQGLMELSHNRIL